MVKSYNVEDAVPRGTPTAAEDVATDVDRRISKLRTVFPQILASSAKNLLLLDLGMAVAFPTIVIPALLNSKTELFFTENEASWFGSIAFICQPVGSIMSGLILEPVGRKRSMLLVCFPAIAGWLLMYFANTVALLYGASALAGLGVGFMEAPIITYVGEICQPGIRGILTSMAGVSALLGFFLTYLLGTLTDWRTAAAICTIVPIITLIAITLIPETPMWLLSKNRKDDALKSLCWLRGWVAPEHVQQEWEELLRYQEYSSKCHACQKSNDKTVACTHNKTDILGAATETCRNMLRKNTLKPFLLVMFFFMFAQCAGLSAIRPFMVQVFRIFRVPLDANWATVLSSLVSLSGNVVCMLCIHHLGKRKISIGSMLSCAICCILLGAWADVVLTPETTSTSAASSQSLGETSWIPWILFILLSFFTSVGVLPVPWMMLSEVFPYKTRGIGSGTAAAACYIMSFAVSKSYLDLEHLLGLRGVFYFYGAISICGSMFLFFCLPETEGKSLEEIEDYFAGRQKSLGNGKLSAITGSIQATKFNSLDGEIHKSIVNGRKSTNDSSEKGFENKAMDLTNDEILSKESNEQHFNCRPMSVDEMGTFKRKPK